MKSRDNDNNNQETSAAKEPALTSVLRPIAIADNQIDSRELFAGMRSLVGVAARGPSVFQ